LDGYIGHHAVFLFIDVLSEISVATMANFGWCQMVHPSNIGCSEDPTRHIFVSVKHFAMFDILVINIFFGFNSMAGSRNNLKEIFVTESITVLGSLNMKQWSIMVFMFSA
jgi:hypothetical protein